MAASRYDHQNGARGVEALCRSATCIKGCGEGIDRQTMMVTPKISGSCGSIAIDEASGMKGSPLIQGHQQPGNALLCRIAFARDHGAVWSRTGTAQP